MSNEVINLWVPINRLDSEFHYPTSDLNNAESSSHRGQSLKKVDTETKFGASSFVVLLDNRSKFDGSSVESIERTDDSAQSEGSAPSGFTGADCGEPFVPQCLVYDFTKRPEDEAVTLKCSKFWNYVYSRPELRKYKKYPSAPVSTEDSETTTTEELNSKENEDQNTSHHHKPPVSTTAIKWLTEGNKGKARLITQATLATVKRCQNYCDSYGSYTGDRDATESETAITRKSKSPLKLHKLGSTSESHGNSAISAKSVKSIRSRYGAELSRSTRWKFAREKINVLTRFKSGDLVNMGLTTKQETALSCPINTRLQSKHVKALCKEMASFDEAHPRNLDPPVQVRLPRPVLRNLVV